MRKVTTVVLLLITSCHVSLYPNNGPVAAQSTISTFTGGDLDGWVGSSGPAGGVGTYVDVESGTPAPSLRTQFNDFGITFANQSDAWTGDFTQAGFTISTDIYSRQVFFFSMDVTRDWIVELRDYDNVPEGMPYVSVWYHLGEVYSEGTGQQDGWRTLSVTVDDPTQTALPAGWGGYGAEDPDTYEPILPANRTFADVLASVDEIAFTTYTPGYFFGFTDYDIAIDNVSLVFVPEPAGIAGLLGLGGLLLRRRR